MTFRVGQRVRCTLNGESVEGVVVLTDFRKTGFPVVVRHGNFPSWSWVSNEDLSYFSEDGKGMVAIVIEPIPVLWYRNVYTSSSAASAWKLSRLAPSTPYGIHGYLVGERIDAEGKIQNIRFVATNPDGSDIGEKE